MRHNCYAGLLTMGATVAQGERELIIHFLEIDQSDEDFR